MDRPRANSATRSITIEQEPASVFGYVVRAENLPQWAPRFAETVRQDGADIIVSSDGSERRFRLRSDAALGVLDFLAAVAPDRYVPGALLRVVPYGPVSEVLFTLLRLPGEDDEAFAVRAAVVDEELAMLRAVC